MNVKVYIVLIGMLALGLASCNNLKKLPQGEKLYTGGTIEFIDSTPIDDKKKIKADLKKLLRPIPNSKIL